MPKSKTDTLKLTRCVHACIAVGDGKSLLFVDPGDFGVPENLHEADAFLVTHDHFDHVSHTALHDLHAIQPSARIYGPESLSRAADFPVHVVHKGDRFSVGEIEVEVLGEWQDVANLNDAPIENLGYFIGDKILHPGDAYLTGLHPELAMVPLAAPWSKAVDTQRWLRAISPKRIVTYHDITLNDMGIEFGRKTVKGMAGELGAEVVDLNPGDSIWL